MVSPDLLLCKQEVYLAVCIYFKTIKYILTILKSSLELVWACLCKQTQFFLPVVQDSHDLALTQKC